MELNINDSDKCVFWISKSNFLAMIEEMEFESFSIDNSLAQDFFGQLVHLTSLRIHYFHHRGEMGLARNTKLPQQTESIAYL